MRVLTRPGEKPHRCIYISTLTLIIPGIKQINTALNRNTFGRKWLINHPKIARRKGKKSASDKSRSLWRSLVWKGNTKRSSSAVCLTQFSHGHGTLNAASHSAHLSTFYSWSARTVSESRSGWRGHYSQWCNQQLASRTQTITPDRPRPRPPGCRSYLQPPWLKLTTVSARQQQQCPGDHCTSQLHIKLLINPSLSSRRSNIWPDGRQGSVWHCLLQLDESVWQLHRLQKKQANRYTSMHTWVRKHWQCVFAMSNMTITQSWVYTHTPTQSKSTLHWIWNIDVLDCFFEIYSTRHTKL